MLSQCGGTKVCLLIGEYILGLTKLWSKAEGPFIVDSSCLLLECINSMFGLHFQLCRCVCFIGRLSIRSETDLPH